MGSIREIVLKGGYGEPYDPRPTLEKLEGSPAEALAELWENLYHQGDVGLASYFSVPALVEAGELSLVAAIEVARQDCRNPEIPDSMVEVYEDALRKALSKTPRDRAQFQAYYVIHASVNNQPKLARALELLSVDEILAEYG